MEAIRITVTTAVAILPLSKMTPYTKEKNGILILRCSGVLKFAGRKLLEEAGLFSGVANARKVR